MSDLIEALQVLIDKYHIDADDVQMVQAAIDSLENDESLTTDGDQFSDPYGDDAMVIVATKDKDDGK